MPLTEHPSPSALAAALEQDSATRVAEAVRDMAAAELVAAGFEREGTLDTSLLHEDNGPCIVAGELVRDGLTGDEMELRSVVQLRGSEAGRGGMRIFIELVSIIEQLRSGRPVGHTLWRHSVFTGPGIDEEAAGTARVKPSAMMSVSLIRPALRARLQLAARTFARGLQGGVMA